MKSICYALAAFCSLAVACRASPGADALYSAEPDAIGAAPSAPDNMLFVNAGSFAFRIDPYEASELAPGEFLPAPYQKPRASISRAEAQLACQRGGKRLCTLAEWTSACLGLHGHSYSYGDQYEDGRCQVSEQAIESGLRRGCRNDAGIFDMVGNLMEWVADDRGELGVVAGGSFQSGERASCFLRLHTPPDVRQNQIGFRCCI